MPDKSTSDTGAPRRVLIYAMNYAPELTGCGRYTGEVGAYLRAQGYEIEIVTTPPHYPGWQVTGGYGNRYTTERSDGVSIYRCPLGLSRNMKGFGRIWAPLSFALSSAPVVFARILSFRPDDVLCIEPTLMAAPVALIASKLTGAHTTLHVQDLEIDAAFSVNHLKGGLLKSLAQAFERVTMSGFDRVVTISNKMMEKLVEKGVKPEKLRLVRNWVDTSRIYPLQGENPYRAELGLKPDQFVALYAGNIGVKQALHHVMDAAAQLVDQDKIVFVIAGQGPEKASLEARNLPNVKFLPLQPEARLNTLLNLADVHLLPQDKGAADLVLPSKIGGMIASKKLIVAMAEPGTELYEFLQGVARFVPCSDASGLADLIGSLQASQTIAPDFGKADVLLSQLSVQNITNIIADA